jgi:K+-transporting ATPase ATPase C chain
MKNILRELRTSFLATIALAVILCGLYPFVIWALGQGLFPGRANGSLIMKNGKIVGSSLVAQGFRGPGYFHPRPSNAGYGYDAAASRGSNLGPMSKKLIEEVGQRIAEYRRENGLGPEIPVPADPVTSSASGLDPDISLKNAFLQARRVAKTRHLPEISVRRLVESLSVGRFLGVLGEPRVNVLKLNLALEANLKRNLG